jgi:carboxypeptidase C (cathepsin A)
MATPFFATEYDIAHIPLKPQTVKNVSFKYYPSGHMIYLNPESLTNMVKDLGTFYDEATPIK